MSDWLSMVPAVLAVLTGLAGRARYRRVRSGWETIPEDSTSQGVSPDERHVVNTGAILVDVPGEVLYASTQKLLAVARENELLVSRGEHEGQGPADLLDLASNEDFVASVISVHEGFDALFLALGPPPDGGRAELERIGSGGGGTAQ
ncbi:hypothetical protein AB0C45_03605 [Streptomyces cyaneofuscatus]|uniref:hypothetical protein n=1 Tax=Streptomyces cyaneofuscatus TaxID=66883 RepID=UPI0033F719F7